jgi:hypothetical protein
MDDAPFGKVKIARDLRKQVPEIALLLMLVGILVPTALYSYHLDHPSPAELLVAICEALFASVLFLWILDATSLMPFRAEWISKSVYGAAIVSVLGTSVAVYKDYFTGSQYPFEGSWQMTLRPKSDASQAVDFSVLVGFSRAGSRYWGYSSFSPAPPDAKSVVWIELTDFMPEEKRLQLRVYRSDGTRRTYDQPLATERKGTLLKSDGGTGEFSLEFRRPPG